MGLIDNLTDEPKEKKFCYWRHVKDEGWYTSCDMAYPFVPAPAWHNCPTCGDFIVIDYYGEHVKVPQEDEYEEE